MKVGTAGEDLLTNEQSFAETVRIRLVRLREWIKAKGVGPLEIRNELLDLDQADPGHTAAPQILDFLHEALVKDAMCTTPEATQMYFRFLSFIEFHVAQIEAMAERYPAAVQHTGESLKSAKEAKVERAWEAYIEATQMYFNGQLIPETLIAEVDPKNRPILERLNEGLKKRGKPNYTEDYYGTAA